MDLSFKNTLIKAYFEGDNSYIPVMELLHIHEHPLIRDSFLVELERMINETTEILVKKNMQGQVVQQFTDAAIKIGAELPRLTRENAPNVLAAMRTVYKLCKGFKTY